MKNKKELNHKEKQYWLELEKLFAYKKEHKIKIFTKTFLHTCNLFNNFQPDNEEIIKYIANKYDYIISDEQLKSNESIYTFISKISLSRTK